MIAAGTSSAALPSAGDAAAADDEHARDVRHMQAFAAGDAAAFRKLFRRHYPGVVNFCFRIVHDRAVAEELAQETFFRLHRARERYQPTARFRTYVLTIAQRLCWNELRRPHRRGAPPLSLDRPAPGTEEDGPRLELVDEAGVDPERHALGRQRLDQVMRVLSEMPERQRTATVLHRFEGQSYEDIAQNMGCSTRAVKSLLNRARKVIVERLGR